MINKIFLPKDKNILEGAGGDGVEGMIRYSYSPLWLDGPVRHRGWFMLFGRTVDEELVCGLVLCFGGGPGLIRGRGLFQHSDRNSVIDLKERFKFLL